MNKALLVAAGILMSRLAGLIRLRAFAHYFGLQSDAADAFNAAFRIPNVLQNLFGEGALSGSFIPVYAGLLARGDREEAHRVASAVGALLALVVSILVALGVVATPVLINVIAPGFTGEKRELTVGIVRILFPGTGLLVLSAWCLGILNSHQKFLLSYTAPVVWNAAMVATLIAFGPTRPPPRLAVLLAWGSVGGSLLQFGVQLPAVARVARIRWRWDTTSGHVRTIVANFVPVFISRGVVQISAYIDTVLASLLPTGAVTGLFSAQVIYTLPVSLFGMSIAAAELTAMSGAVAADPGGAAVVRQRLGAALRQVAFLVVPSAMAFLALGDIVAAALLQTGRFTAGDARYIWGILAGSALGLLRIHAWPAVLVHLLRAARHAHAFTVRDGARGADHGARLSVRDTPTAVAGRAAIVGRGGTDLLGRDRRVGRDADAAAGAQCTHRLDRTDRDLPGPTVVRRWTRRCRRLGHPPGRPFVAPARDGRDRARSIRHRLLRRGIGARLV